MARPISLEIAPGDPRAELQARLRDAPLEHAQSLLAAYEVLQGLHDRGAFELLRGLLGASDRTLELMVEAARAPESVAAIRNLLALAKLLGSIDPEVLGALARTFAKSLPEAIALTRSDSLEPPGLWSIMRKLRNKDARRSLALVTAILEAFGRSLPSEEPV